VLHPLAHRATSCFVQAAIIACKTSAQQQAAINIQACTAVCCPGNSRLPGCLAAETNQILADAGCQSPSSLTDSLTPTATRHQHLVNLSTSASSTGLGTQPGLQGDTGISDWARVWSPHISPEPPEHNFQLVWQELRCPKAVAATRADRDVAGPNAML
jgi:hypothetical protein